MPSPDGPRDEQGVQLVAELLTARGYMAEGAASENEGATLRIHNCAMCEIAEQFPEACEVEARQLAPAHCNLDAGIVTVFAAPQLVGGAAGPARAAPGPGDGRARGRAGVLRGAHGRRRHRARGAQ